jgi:hypothetical protein
MSMSDSVIGHLMAFKRRNPDDSVVEVDVLVELTEVQSNGLVEIAFDDRDERVYLQLPLAEIVAFAVRSKPSDEL